MIGDRLDRYTFEYLINEAISMVPNDVDKREGSIIYDALAPACYELANYYLRLKNLLRNTFAITAVGQYLDLRVQEHGLHRYLASKALKKGHFFDKNENPFEVPIGSRFATISDSDSINYRVIEPFIFEGNVVPGVYVLECEEKGTKGNLYNGDVLPLTYINGLISCYIDDIIIPARDDETDEELRTRYFDSLKFKPFGGNIIQYKEMLQEIDGVGAAQIYPVWNGGGTVKCVVIDPDYNKITPEFQNILQEMIDPDIEGLGLGLVPIGHKVTVTTPQEIEISISATITLTPGYIFDQVEQPILDVLQAYMLESRQRWGIGSPHNYYSLSILVSRITAEIMGVTGIHNVQNITLNGNIVDIHLTQDAFLQQIPVLGEVTLNVD